MSTFLSNYSTGRDNNFNLIRFIAAALVLISHSYALVIGTPEAEPLRSTLGLTLGDIAVDIFFISSGFLITHSYLTKSDLKSFIWARVLRIYPALILSTLICAFILGGLFTNFTLFDYFQQSQTFKFIIKNTVLILGVEYQLPGVFTNTPYKHAVNGSLWTLPYEIKMYALISITISLVYFFKPQKNNLYLKISLLLICILSFTFHMYNQLIEGQHLNFIRLLYLFFLGALIYVFKENIKMKWAIFNSLFAILLLSSLYPILFLPAYYIILPYILFFLVYIPKGKVLVFNKFGDYSYGIYIYAFPIQQSIIALIPNISVINMIIISFIFTLILSILSWKYVEKTSLKYKNIFIKKS